ncbi:MAG: peptide ABC transporter substrate-binding protein [Vulcanimicrobiaceae bacterium]
MRRGIIAFLIAVALAQSGCSRIGSSYAPKNTLRIAVLINPNTLNPILAANTVESFIDGLFSSELITLDQDGKEIPDLATAVPTIRNHGISSDGLTITYHLRPNARWQDGVPVTSRDVAFTWRAIMNPNNNVIERTGYEYVRSVLTPNAHTVVFKLIRPYAPFVRTVFSESDSPFRILPMHLLAGYANLNAIPYNSHPIGSGPYRVVRWVRGDRIELAANPTYYRGAPKIAKILIRIIPSVSTIESELRAGNLDLGHEINAATAHDLQHVPGVRVVQAHSPNYTSIAFNASHSFFKDANVRRAFAMAIDSASLIRHFYHGYAQDARADLTPFSWGYDSKLAPRRFDPRQAARLLDNAGWILGRDGIRHKNGKRLDVLLVYGNTGTTVQDFVVSIASMLRSIGVESTMKGFALSLFYAPAQEHGILNSGNFDLALYPWVSGSDPDNSSQFLCAEIPPAGNNIFRYCSKKTDALEIDALRTYGRTARKRDYAQIEEQLMNDVPLDVLAYPGLLYVTSNRFHGFRPNGISEGWNAQDWHF